MFYQPVKCLLMTSSKYVFFYFQGSSQMLPRVVATEQQSLVVVKKLLAIAVSSITYLRGLFPEKAYGSKYVEGKRNTLKHWAIKYHSAKFELHTFAINSNQNRDFADPILTILDFLISSTGTFDDTMFLICIITMNYDLHVFTPPPPPEQKVMILREERTCPGASQIVQWSVFRHTSTCSCSLNKCSHNVNMLQQCKLSFFFLIIVCTETHFCWKMPVVIS